MKEDTASSQQIDNIPIQDEDDISTLVDFGTNTTLPASYKKTHVATFSSHDLSAHEQNILTILSAKTLDTHWENGKTPKYEFTAAELSQWLNIETKHIASTLGKPAKRLSERTIGFESDLNGGEFEYCALFSLLRYKNSKLVIIPNPYARSFLLDYSKGYGIVNPMSNIKLKGQYSKRLYDMLSRFKTGGTYLPPKTISELKKTFKVVNEKGELHASKQSFKVGSTFIKRCIASSIEEITEVLPNEILFFKGEDGHLGYTAKKLGAKFNTIQFHYKWINNKAMMDNDTAYTTVKELENKRLVKKETLTNTDMQLLAYAYLSLELRDKAIHYFTLAHETYNDKASVEEAEAEKEDDKLQSLLDKIAQLEALESGE